MEKKYPIEVKEIPEPVGKFILDQKDLSPTPGRDGRYWHYKDVVTLLTRYLDYKAASTRESALTVYVPCHEEDENCCGFYQSLDGQHLGYVRESTVPVVEQGARWVKATTRLPHHFRAVFVKIEGTKSVAAWHKDHERFVDDAGDFHPADQVEWLDESGENGE